MWELASAMASVPRSAAASTALRLDMVPVGMKTASSWPRMLAPSRSRSFTVGSVWYTSSPSSACAIASIIAGVGSVDVS